MRTLWGWIIGIVIIAAIIIGVIAATGSNDKNKNTNQNTTTPPPTSSNNPSPTSNQTATATDKVTIENMSFSPAKITIKKGTKVTWTNNDSVGHTVTADSGSGPSSQTLNPGQSYDFTFNNTGTFAYHCSIHPNMTASVTVTE